ncbi:MAG: hypothetical protein R3A13_05115 [Bdellovibrionota bacterium]
MTWGETDILILSEINSSFMDALKLRLSKDKNYQKHKERVFFILGPVQEIDNSEPLDIIICGIPFLNLDIPTIENIFSKLCQMSKPETLMTFYQYMGMRSLAKILPPKSRQDRVKRIENFFDQHFSEKHQNVLKVWLNFLPINIYTIKPYYYLQPAN